MLTVWPDTAPHLAYVVPVHALREWLPGHQLISYLVGGSHVTRPPTSNPGPPVAVAGHGAGPEPARWRYLHLGPKSLQKPH